MSADIGVAVIGFGLGGRVFHAPFVSAVPGLRLEAIVQRKGDEAAKAYPAGVRILRSFEEALSDAAVQLVVVSTPNETHFALAKACARGGQACGDRQAVCGDERGGAGVGGAGGEEGVEGGSVSQPALGWGFSDGAEAGCREGGGAAGDV